MKRADLVRPVENENITDPTERFIIGVNDFKQSSGYWYSLFALRILPFLLFILPVNVVLGRINGFIQSRFMPDVELNKTPLLVMWIVVMAGFLAVAILSPKAATVIEFLFGFAYLFFTFRYHLFGSFLGYAVLIGMIIFLLVKLVFLAFKIISAKHFSNDTEDMERDESGRIVRNVEEEVYLTDENNDDPITPTVTDEVYFSDAEVQDRGVSSFDEVFFAVNEESKNDAPAPDDDFFFGQ